MQGIRTKTLLFIVAISLLANIIMLIYFVGIRNHHRSPHDEQPNSPITVFLEQNVGFSKQQMEQYYQLRTENRKKMKPMFEDMRTTKAKFYEHLNDKQINDSILAGEATLIAEKQKAIDLQTFRNFRQIGTICTGEQKQQYDSLVAGVISKWWFSPRSGPPHDEKRK